jgi:hypothetical protein
MAQESVPLTMEQAAARRRAVRRTVFVFAGIAILVYVGFIVMGMSR